MRKFIVAVIVAGAWGQAAAGDVIVGAGAGGGPSVKVFDEAALETDSFLAYSAGFLGGVRVAAGDVNGDSVSDVITGAGDAGNGHVKVFDGTTGAEIRSFLAYGGGYTGGVFVGGGDVTKDLHADIVTGADSGVAPHVKVFDGVTNAEVRSFFAFTPSFLGGVRVAAGDVNGDGFADIITGAGAAGSGHVKVFDGATNGEIRSFFAYGGGYTGGIFVAAGDVNNDGKDDIITGVDAGAQSHVKVFDAVTGTELRSFFAYGPSFTGGVRVAAGDVNGDGFADIITGEGDGGGGNVKVFSGSTGLEIHNFLAFGLRHTGGIYVAGTTFVPEPTGVGMVVVAGLMMVRRRRADH